MTEHLALPARLDSSGAPLLQQLLEARRGRPLVLDAAGVEMVGALALEVVVAAGRQWAADGHSLALTGLSARWQATCVALGLRAEAPWCALQDVPA